MNNKYLSEFLGTLLLTSCVVGSGIMAENLSNGNLALALLANTIATGAILFVIIKMFSQISGAHFNPIVSFTFFLKRELEINDFVYYVAIQIISALLNIITWLVIIDVVMSLLIQFRILDQRNQIVSQIWLSIRNVLEPLYSRIRSFLPNTIGFDLAPAVLLFGIFAIQTIIRNNFNHY